MALVLDNNGIWINDSAKERIYYPETDYNYTFYIEDLSFWFKHRNKVILAAIKKFPFSGNFADVGGGNGFQVKFLSEQFPDKNIYLVEPAYQGCLNAKKRNVKNVYNVFFSDFPASKSDIGGIGLFDVLEHIENDVDFLKEIKEHFKKGTRIYITVPAYKWLWSDVDDYSKHFRRYDNKMLKHLARKAGVTILMISKFFSYLPFLTFIFRSIPYKFSGKKKDGELIQKMMESHEAGKFATWLFNYFNKTEISVFERNKINFGASCIAAFEI